MKLTESRIGHTYDIRALGEEDKTKRQLLHMGLVPGSAIHLVSEVQGNLVVLVRESRLGLSKELAERIEVEEKTERTISCSEK